MYFCLRMASLLLIVLSLRAQRQVRCVHGSQWTLPPKRQCLRCHCTHNRIRCFSARRIRKEIHDLTAQEFSKFAAAINKLKQSHQWEEFIGVHVVQSWDSIHGQRAHFLHWHRLFIYALETLLIHVSHDCSIALPYWDWTLESRAPAWYGVHSTTGSTAATCILAASAQGNFALGGSRTTRRSGCPAERAIGMDAFDVGGLTEGLPRWRKWSDTNARRTSASFTITSKPSTARSIVRLAAICVSRK
eukprot:GEMP01041906.1.p1 GENE.GEMP01041906.1~~GEMP01041906.1.p1  ORF type:complete len:246 (+),score=41.81 GEMP01041906.1:88-825(+)